MAVTAARRSPAPRTVHGRNRDEAADLVDAAGDVAQRDGRAGQQAADEPAAGLVVAGEEQPERHHQHGVEHDPHRDVDERRAGATGVGGRRRRARRRSRRRVGDRRGRARPRRWTATASTVISPSVSKPAEVDEDHVDDVAAVAVGHRAGDHLVGDRRGEPVTRGDEREDEDRDADRARDGERARPDGGATTAARSARAAGGARARTRPSRASRPRPG